MTDLNQLLQDQHSKTRELEKRVTERLSTTEKDCKDRLKSAREDVSAQLANVTNENLASIETSVQNLEQWKTHLGQCYQRLQEMQAKLARAQSDLANMRNSMSADTMTLRREIEKVKKRAEDEIREQETTSNNMRQDIWQEITSAQKLVEKKAQEVTAAIKKTGDDLDSFSQ